jgi:hypothetical protein
MLAAANVKETKPRAAETTSSAVRDLRARLTSHANYRVLRSLSELAVALACRLMAVVATLCLLEA